MLGDRTLLSGRYLLTSRLGGGGMGEVWRADDTLLGRTVAVKVLTHNPASTQRFHNEAKAMATLNHPGVVDVYDYGADRVAFLVMELVEGESLDRLLERATLSPEATMLLVAEVADALAAAHERGIVHRDVKPGNLMIRTDGRVALTDFGIAHSATGGQLTVTGQMLCSAGYCAPEQATANTITPAVDVYALGVVAFECLAGQLPYQGDTPVQIIFKHLNAPVPELPPEIPPGPRQVVERALAKDPARRWPSAAAMAEAARRALDPAAPLPPRRGRRSALTVTVTVAAAVVTSGVIAGSLHLWPPLSPGRLLPEPSAKRSAGDGPRPPAMETVQPAKERMTPEVRKPSPTPGATAWPTARPSSRSTRDTPSPWQPSYEPSLDDESEGPTTDPTEEPESGEPIPSHQSGPAVPQDPDAR